MKGFLKKMIKGNVLSPSLICLESFNNNFKNAINVEWFDKETYYEAVFYKDRLEYIAMFDLTGNLIEYKLNLPIDYLPEPFRLTVEEKGEIMNAVMRNKGNLVEYEIIYRDNKLNRFLVIISDVGKMIEEIKL